MVNKSMKKNAMVLCSGGLDSVVTAHYVKDKLDYNRITVLFFDYGQKSLKMERKCSKNCANVIKAGFVEIKLPELAKLSTSLINKTGEIKRLDRKDLKNTEGESKKWYVPNRNMIFISYALSLADKLQGKFDVFLGFKCEGKESYPDTTLDFVNKFNRLITTMNINCRVIAPLIKKDKEDIVILGKKLGVNFRNTFSCYIGKKKHCGYCLACMLRKEGFYWAGVKDPTDYSAN